MLQSNNPLVSVIIPIVKNDPHIHNNLLYLHASSYKNIEFLVIDEGKERSYQRNVGIKRATGKYVMYLDSDQYVSPDLIKECVNLCESGYDALYIPEQITTKGFFAYLRNWERRFYTATPIDCVRFMRRDICPEFDETLNGPEDSCHDRRVFGKRATTSNVFYHEDGVTLFRYLKKKAYYSKSMKRFADKYPNDKVLSWKWRCFAVFFENGKWRQVLKRPDLFLLVMLLIATRGVIYLCNR